MSSEGAPRHPEVQGPKLVGGAGDPRRAELNPDWALVDGQWIEAPLPVTRSAASASPQLRTESKDRGPILTDSERLWLASDEAKAIAAAASREQDVRDAQQVMKRYDAAMADRYGDVLANAEMPWLDEPADPDAAEARAAFVAERASVDAKWDEINAAVRRRTVPGNDQGRVAA